MQFIEEKNAINLRGAAAKQKQTLEFAKQKAAADLKIAKQKAKEGGNDGKGKQTTTS
jgi:hypothetical protein